MRPHIGGLRPRWGVSGRAQHAAWAARCSRGLALPGARVTASDSMDGPTRTSRKRPLKNEQETTTVTLLHQDFFFDDLNAARNAGISASGTFKSRKSVSSNSLSTMNSATCQTRARHKHALQERRTSDTPPSTPNKKNDSGRESSKCGGRRQETKRMTVGGRAASVADGARKKKNDSWECSKKCGGRRRIPHRQFWQPPARRARATSTQNKNVERRARP